MTRIRACLFMPNYRGLWYSKARKKHGQIKNVKNGRLIQARKAEENKALIALQHDKVAENVNRSIRAFTMANNDHHIFSGKRYKMLCKIKINSDGNLVIPAIDIHNKIWTCKLYRLMVKTRFYKGKKEGTFSPFSTIKTAR